MENRFNNGKTSVILVHFETKSLFLKKKVLHYERPRLILPKLKMGKNCKLSLSQLDCSTYISTTVLDMMFNRQKVSFLKGY